MKGSKILTFWDDILWKEVSIDDQKKKNQPEKRNI